MANDMNNAVFDTNIKALMQKCPELSLEEIELSLQQACPTSLLTFPADFPNISFNYNHQKFHLYDGAEPLQTIEALVGKQLSAGPVSHILNIGMGLGLLQHEILARKSTNAKVFVVEPNLRVLLETCKYIDLSPIFDHPDILIFLQSDANIASKEMGALINISNSDFKGWRFIISTPTLALYKDFATQFVHVFGSIMSNQKLQLNTLDLHGERTLRNSLLNLKHLNGNSYLSSYKDAYKGKSAILIAAGPSLKKQLPKLKEVQNNHILIAAGQTIKTLHANGIHPHFVVAADPQDALQKYFDSDAFTREVLLCLTVCSSEVVSKFPGHKIFFQYTPKIDESLSSIIGHMGSVPLGGSVANIAYSLARYFGIDDIALIGQDLAFTNGESHTDGYVGKKVRSEDEMAKSHRYRKVPGYYGDMLYTNRQMDTYRNWFEQVLENDNRVKLFNCTEGGSKIQGAVQIPFAEYLDTHSIQSFETIAFHPVSISDDKLNQLFTKDLQVISKIYTIANDGCEACIKGIKNDKSPKLVSRARKSLIKLRSTLSKAEQDFNPYLFFLWNKSMMDMSKIDVDQNASTADILKPYVTYFKHLLNACQKSQQLIHKAITQ
jgi:hypothetical protein